MVCFLREIYRDTLLLYLKKNFVAQSVTRQDVKLFFMAIMVPGIFRNNNLSIIYNLIGTLGYKLWIINNIQQ